MAGSRALMFQGTASDAGKSLVVAGVCRALMRRGLSVRPFKPQNMSNNAAVTADGGEIGRAQALQARAAGVAPCVDMNPVLLKPQSDVGAQLVVRGEVCGNFAARQYQEVKPHLMALVRDSFNRLKRQCDMVVVEGAGSASEVNLRKGDIANMGFALAENVPVVLVADIDRGGVIANLVGTADLLPPEERALVTGYLINRFRGDAGLFGDGLATITQKTGFRSLGILPFLDAARRLPQEDAYSLERTARTNGDAVIRVAVPRLAHISNFDDFDPLIAEPDVEVTFVPPGEALPGDADLIVLPGSKATIADLKAFRAEGWDIDLQAHLRRGGKVLGICGGYQMLGGDIRDPDGIEGAAKRCAGLDLFDMTTVLTPGKTLREVYGVSCPGHGIEKLPVHGYEMHVGNTSGAATDTPFLIIDGRPEGAVSADGRVMGCYVHGLFASDAFREGFLGSLKQREFSGIVYDATVEAALDEVADALESHLDMDALIAAAA